MNYQPEQTVIPGTIPPEPEIDAETKSRLNSWLDRKGEIAHSRELQKNDEAALIVACREKGYTRLPYVDAKTGKRRFWFPDTTPRAKTIAAAGSPKARKGRRGRDKDVQIGQEVESRRVPRTAEHDAVTDPFATTRGLLEEAKAAQDVGEWKKADEDKPNGIAPKLPKGKKGK